MLELSNCTTEDSPLFSSIFWMPKVFIRFYIIGGTFKHWNRSTDHRGRLASLVADFMEESTSCEAQDSYSPNLQSISKPNQSNLPQLRSKFESRWVSATREGHEWIFVLLHIYSKTSSSTVFGEILKECADLHTIQFTVCETCCTN